MRVRIARRAGWGTVAFVSSNLSCVGLAMATSRELGELVSAVLPHAVLLGHSGGVDVLRWQDSSGARLLLGVKDRRLADLLPSFAGTPGAYLARLAPLNDPVWHADVLDQAGDQVTAMAVELEQHRLLPASAGTATFRASVACLGVDVSVHADAGQFAASPASLLDPAADTASEPPAHYRERGWAWPPRVGPESFIPDGLFAAASQARAYARLAGTVLHAERRTVTLTSQDFTVARVRTAGFDTDLCLAAADHPAIPEPGSIIAGTVFLVAALDDVPGS
jgi:hypothetical protein